VSTTHAVSSGPPGMPVRHSSGLTWLAFLVSLVAVGGSLWFTLGMQLKPCPLCYYQRSFAMAAAAVLFVGLFSAASRSNPVSLFALPCAAAGAGIAGWHVYLEYLGKLECPKGILDIGTAPQQSVAALGLLLFLLIIDALRIRVTGGSRILGVLFGLIAGAGMTYGCFVSVLPMPQPPDKPYEKKDPDICRPPYVAPKVELSVLTTPSVYGPRLTAFHRCATS
jgi:Disulfide bond formation protein DsbB